MKKLIAICLMLNSLSVSAATTATLTLQGIIAEILDISVTPETLATSLPLDQAVNGQKVATVTERANSASGYQVSVSSANAGKLVLTGDNAHFVAYQLSYNNSNIVLSASPTVISTNAQRGEFNRDINITYSQPADFMAAGEYSDIVTFTIAAN